MLDRKLIGHSFGQRKITVEKGAVCAYAHAIGETDPIYLEPAAAREAGYRNVVVPPTFLSCLEGRIFKTADTLKLTGMDFKRILHGEQSYEYLVPVVAGDVLTYEPRIVDIYDKKNGALQFLVKETRITNQDGVHVANTRGVLVQR